MTEGKLDNVVSGSVVKPAKLAHFVLRTSKYEELKKWYMFVFGAHVVFENGELAFLTYDGEHHRIAIVKIPDLIEAPEGTAGVHHIAFTYGSLPELIATFERLRDAGIKPVYPINHGPTTSLYYADPDGNQLELQVENFDTVEQSTAFFFTEAFRENPIGVEFDPEDLARRWRAGESEESLKLRPDIGPQDLGDVRLR